MSIKKIVDSTQHTAKIKKALGGLYEVSKEMEKSIFTIYAQKGKERYLQFFGLVTEILSMDEINNIKQLEYIKLKSTGVNCPREGCTGEIVERKSRRGKTFYGCSNYPDCDFVLWNKPISEPCPLCGAKYTIVKTTKKSGAVRYCNSEDCKFKESIEV